MVSDSTREGSDGETPEWEQRVKEAGNDPEACMRCLGKGYVTVPKTVNIPKKVECTMCDGSGRVRDADNSDR